jgi:hypothetical protein
MSRMTPVHVTVIHLEPVQRGCVLALAAVEISIAGIPVTLQGLKLRRGLDGRLSVELPMYERPNGERVTCIGLYDDLARGVVDEVAAAWERRAAIGDHSAAKEV